MMGQKMVKAVARPHTRRATAFIGIGAVNTMIDFSAFACLYGLVGLDPVISNVLAFLIAVTNSYVLNTLITFGDRRSTRGTFRSFARFLFVAVISMTVSTAIVHFLSMVMHPLVAKLIAIAASTVVSYIGCYRFVFTGESGEARRASTALR
jgi:putative flippase GtrA